MTKRVVTQAKTNDLQKIQTFIKEHWKENHVFVYNKQLLNWQHLNTKNKHYNYYISRNDSLSGLDSLLGFIPQNQFDVALPKEQLFLAIWKKNDAVKDLGLGVALLKQLVKDIKPSFIGAIGLSKEVFRYYKAMKYEVGQMDLFVLISPFIDRFLIAKINRNFRLPQSIADSSSCDLKELMEADLLKIGTNFIYESTPLKSTAFLINRYIRHPIYNYIFWGGSENGKLKCIIIVRKIELNHRCILRIVDIQGDISFFSRLGTLFLKKLKIHEAEYLDCYSVGVTSKLYLDAGFINRKQYSEDIIIPNYFEPFKQSNIEIDYAYINKDATKKVRLFRGDSDQDRPNIK